MDGPAHETSSCLGTGFRFVGWSYATVLVRLTPKSSCQRTRTQTPEAVLIQAVGLHLVDKTPGWNLLSGESTW